MTISQILALIVLALLLAGAAYWCGRMDGYWRRAAEERRRLDRYRGAVDALDKWCGFEFPQARLIAAHLHAVGEGHGLNAGTPAGDEPCTISGLREQLRRLKAAPLAYEQIADMLQDHARDSEEMHDFAREVERAHGIRVDTSTQR